eukprot:TRINITY_DN3484_c0_g2_i1.p2 TRINITY_DN3484_c0_g2~~TRINITY_DN3484_c0_g2_i1.p2  ORF type:complete len:159 (+),score=37.01 TRINITY_DN3484_c0_g2_i1:317-793(+)
MGAAGVQNVNVLAFVSAQSDAALHAASDHELAAGACASAAAAAANDVASGASVAATPPLTTTRSWSAASPGWHVTPHDGGSAHVSTTVLALTTDAALAGASSVGASGGDGVQTVKYDVADVVFSLPFDAVTRQSHTPSARSTASAVTVAVTLATRTLR